MIGAEIERQREFAQDRADAVGDLRRDMGEQRLVLRHLAGKARAPPAQQSAVEQLAHPRSCVLRLFRPAAPGSIMASMAIGGAEITSDATLRDPGLSAAVALRGALLALADLLLPPVCIACRKRVGAHGLLCGDCWTKIDFIAPPLCDRLGVPLPYETGSPKPLGGGNRRSASLRPGAGRRALFLDHARPDPELQISRPA